MRVRGYVFATQLNEAGGENIHTIEETLADTRGREQEPPPTLPVNGDDTTMLIGDFTLSKNGSRSW